MMLGKNLYLGLIALGLFAASCGGHVETKGKSTKPGTTSGPSVGDGKLAIVSPKIEAFQNQGELDAYFGKIFSELADRRAKQEAEWAKMEKDSGASGAISKSASGADKAPQASADPSGASDESSSGSSNETITNNQVSGVDEGGIVKNIGDSLVVLRQGRLYAAKTAASGPVQTDSLDVARDATLLDSVWYDELLVKGDLLYVVGYRYGNNEGFEGDIFLDNSSPCQASYAGATEINTFRLKDGKFERLQTRFFESSDYFSGSNYTSRMVDGKFVVYMPYNAMDYCDSSRKYSIHIPQELAYDAKTQDFKAIKPVFTAINIFKNVEQISSNPVFHTVMSCDLPADGSLSCKAQAIIGDYVEERFVSANSVYLFSSDRIYSLGLKDLSMKAHARDLNSSVANQFAFNETADTLQVLTVDAERGVDDGPIYDEEMGDAPSESDEEFGLKAIPVLDPKPPVSTPEPITDPEVGIDPIENGKSVAQLKLYSFPIAAFDDQGIQKLDGLAATLADSSSYYIQVQQRFIGNNLVYSLAGQKEQMLHSYDTVAKTDKKIALSGAVNRIEVLNANLAFVSSSDYVESRGQSKSLLTFATVKLDQPELVMQRLSSADAFEGDSRSHAFSQKKLADGSHLFGIPTAKYTSFGESSSALNFFLVAPDASLKSIGKVEAGIDSGVCKSSCADWYGNTRPIFLGDRIFGLMGDEIVEIALGQSVSVKGPRLRFTSGQAE